MSAEAILMWIMFGSLLGVCACCVYDWIVRKRIERETDELMRRGMPAISAEEIDELLSRPSRPIQPHEFQVVQGNKILRLERPDTGSAT